MSQWIEEVGESRLQMLSELEDSLEQLHHKQTVFREFYTAAYVCQLFLIFFFAQHFSPPTTASAFGVGVVLIFCEQMPHNVFICIER